MELSNKNKIIKFSYMWLLVLTHRWCHFLGNLSQMDCSRFSIASPENKVKTNIGLVNKLSSFKFQNVSFRKLN